MSQNKFVSLPVLSLKRSKIFLFIIIGLHLIALASLVYTIYFHISVNVILALLIVFSFCYYILYYIKLSDLKMIKYRADGMWILGYESKPLLVSIDSDYMLTEWLIVLRFNVGKTQRRTLPIFFDMLPQQIFKQLRVVLPYIMRLKD